MKSKKRVWTVVVLLGGLVGGVPVSSARDLPFQRGDVNQDGAFDLSDCISVLLHLFSGGHEAPCEKAADIDDQGDVNLTDAVYGLQFLFQAGPPPPAPHGVCGDDPTPDDLTCAASPCPSEFPRLLVAERCTGDPGTQLGWSITSLEDEPLRLEWEIVDTAQSGVLDLAARATEELTTTREPGVNVLSVRFEDRQVARLANAGVIISELMASNSDTLADEDGNSSDWIELYAVDSPCAPTIDLTDWFLTDDPVELSKWRLPAVSLSAGEHLLIFASGKDRTDPDGELHTSFSLDADGEYLALVAPDGLTVVDEIAPAYPEQLRDVSYGTARSSTDLIEVGADVQFHVPTAADAGLGDGWADPAYAAAGWKSGATGLGFSGIETEGFEVTCYKANVAVGSLTDALGVIANPARQSAVATESAPYIDYFNSGGSGNFGGDHPFPGIGPGDIDDFVVRATGTILIPEAGVWSFGVNSDDGFRLDIRGFGQTFRTEHPTVRGPADTIEAFDFPQAGPYDLTLFYYERGGGAELELFAAKGNHPLFNYDAYRLVGDTATGGLGLLGFASDIETDLGGDMAGENASVWVRLPFEVEDPSDLGGLLLRMRYEDGFVVYLNGQEVTSRNAPATLAWNSTAVEDRPIEDAPVAEEISLTGHIGRLREGTNLLAIHGLNESVDDTDFLLVPELVGVGQQSELQYMASPTPGEFNVSGSVDFVRRVEFSEERGYFDAPFTLALSTPTEGAQIRYTLDGSTPTATRGFVYSAPVTVDETTVIRAAAFRERYLDSEVGTRSYFFASDIIRQSPSGQRPGTGWPTGSVNGQVIDYGMDPEVVDSPRWSGDMIDAMLAVPSISLVTDLDNLFGSSTGIYVNATNDGRAWERRTSVELIHPDGTEGFGVDAGLRIRGAFSRSDGNPKHSFRVIFRSEYGAGRLAYALFGGEGADDFDKVDLRTSQNYSWAYQGDAQNTMLRDVFSRDVQSAMGQPYTRSRYYHLFLNGHYWGLYQTQERADAEFAQTYLKGDSEAYDVIKNDSSGSRALQATDGNMEAYRRLYDAAVTGFGTDARYLAILGRNADGTTDPEGEQLIDPENLIDYMICTYYTGDPDAPVSCWAHFSNNVFAIYNRLRRDGFTWYRHDAEHSLGSSGGLNEDRLLTDPTDRSIGQQWQHFNPAWLHLRLTSHPEYRMLFSDRVNRYFHGGGILASDANVQRWLDRAEQIQLAIIAESARWGDAQRRTPRTKDDWQSQVDYMVSTYFPQRTQIVLDQMRSVSMFPDAAIISFNQNGGEVETGFHLLMSQSNGTPGTIYYTLDGTDPREWGGGVSPAAEIYTDDSTGETLIARGSVWRYLDDGSNQGTVWRTPGFSDAGWAAGPAQLGYGDGDEATEVSFGPDDDDKYPTTYFRHTFSVEDASAITQLTLGIVCDDGAVVYVNGTEVTRINMPAGTIGYQTWAEGDVPVGGDDESRFRSYGVDPGLLVDGGNLIAVEVHQDSGTSSDISFDLELSGVVPGGSTTDVTIDESTTVKARVRTATEWGALTEARFTVGLEGLVINEVMASNHDTLEDPDEPGEYPDWVEIYNGTGRAIDLGGMYLTDDPQELDKWQIAAGVGIGAGEYLIIYADDDGTQGPLHTSYKLSASGETLVLVDSDGHTAIDTVVFDQQFGDVSWSRYPDGADDWGFQQPATPGAANLPHVP